MKAEVRRLTEKECCRLQGIPDDHPFIHGEDTSGSSVYQICGNGWARNCSRLVFKNIHLVDGKHTGGVRLFKIGTVSSGQGTHELSVHDFGDKSVFCSEIAPFPCEVLKKRFGMINLGDVTRIRYDAGSGVIHNHKKDGYEMMSEAQLGFKPVDAEDVEISLKYGEIDCISGGLPCTSISVAGKRHGAAEGSGTRSALAYELPRIGKECGARWLVYENVPGLVSSNGGTDLAWFLYRLQEAGYSVAWRTLDAQFVRSDTHPRAVPQRRRRIWLVAYRGDDWRIPCEVLFEPMKALGSVPPVRTVGVGFDGKFKAAVLGGSSQEGEPKTELQEFELFLSKADRRILDVLSQAGICVTPEERLNELRSIEMKQSSNDGAGDLFSADLFGDVSEIVEPHQGRGLKAADLDLRLPEEGCIRNLKPYEVFEWAKTVCSDVLYGGELFKAHEGDPTVDDLTPAMLANLGNAGFLSDGLIYTMKMPEWNAGVTEEELATMPKDVADLYDGDVCGLCDVLDDLVDPKYTLSWRACYGILNRSSKRGKMLPIELGYALVQRILEQASFVRWQAEFGKDDAPEGKVSERQIAKTCYDGFVEFMIPYSECKPVNPKDAGVDCSAEEEAAERMLGDGDEEYTEESGDDVTEV